MSGFLSAFCWHVLDFFISEAASQGIEAEAPPPDPRARKLAQRGRRLRRRVR